MIPLASPLAQYRAHGEAIRHAIHRVLESGTYILGREVEQFERAFADYCGTAHAVSVASGTDALVLGLKALGIGPGDEVITVSHTAIATVAAILAAGADPVLVDVEPDYFTIDAGAIEGALTGQTKAIVAVHLYGQPTDMEAVAAVASRHGLRLIEDCAQAAGARYRGNRVGGIGDIGCFSFYPTKNLGAIGDGGMVVTKDAGIAGDIRRLRQYGWGEGRETAGIGVNSRLDPIQAAILGSKLPSLDQDNARRAAIAARYDAAFREMPLVTPQVRPDVEHVYHLYVAACDDRDRFREFLRKRGVETGIHYPKPAHWQKGYAERIRVAPGGLGATERLAGRIVSLPIYPELTDAEADEVIAAVRAYYAA